MSDLRLRLIDNRVALIVFEQILAYVLVRIVSFALAPRTEGRRDNATRFCTESIQIHFTITSDEFWFSLD